jgi:hypothetical protein
MCGQEAADARSGFPDHPLDAGDYRFGQLYSGGTIQRDVVRQCMGVAQLDCVWVELGQAPQIANVLAGLGKSREQVCEVMREGKRLTEGAESSLERLLQGLLGQEAEDLVGESLRVEHAPECS